MEQHAETTAPVTVNRAGETLAQLSLIFGILGFFILGIPFGIAAVILGGKALSTIAEDEPNYKMAHAGEIIGWIDIFFSLLAIMLIVVITA